MINLVNEYNSLKKSCDLCQKKIKDIDKFLEADLFMEAIEEMEKLQVITEKMANKSRSLSITYAVSPFNKDQIKYRIVFNQDVKIKTNKDFVYLELPFLLNKKEEGSAEFIKQTVYSAFDLYFYDSRHKIEPFDEEMIIVYEHCYQKGYKSYRDHDNIDVNMITDTLSGYFLKDDSPMYLSHYYFSNFDSDSNKTKVYLIKKKDFVDFLNKEGIFNEQN